MCAMYTKHVVNVCTYVTVSWLKSFTSTQTEIVGRQGPSLLVPAYCCKPMTRANGTVPWSAESETFELLLSGFSSDRGSLSFLFVASAHPASALCLSRSHSPCFCSSSCPDGCAIRCRCGCECHGSGTNLHSPLPILGY